MATSYARRPRPNPRLDALIGRALQLTPSERWELIETLLFVQAVQSQAPRGMELPCAHRSAAPTSRSDAATCPTE